MDRLNLRARHDGGPSSTAVEGLRPEEFDLLAGFLYERTGIRYGRPKMAYVARRALQRLNKSGHPSFAGYLSALRRDPEELQALINLITVNETYFMREPKQLECLAEVALPALTRTKPPLEPVRVWSLPCATGEEAYSIALWLRERPQALAGRRLTVVGSDIDTEALAKAAAGRYGPRSLQRLDPRLVAKYFEPEPEREGAREVGAALRQDVAFRRHNVLDPPPPGCTGFDVVFCRNMLIYFDEASKRAAVARLRAALAPGGYLFLGASENAGPLNPGFETCWKGETAFYRAV